MDSKLRGNLSLLSRSVIKYTVFIMEIFTLETKGFRRKLKRLLFTMKRCVVVTEVFRAILEAYMLEMKPTASRTGCCVLKRNYFDSEKVSRIMQDCPGFELFVSH